MFIKQLLYSLSRQIRSALRLELNDDVCEFEISLLLQMGKDSAPEEDLTLPDPVEVFIQIQGIDHLDHGFLAIHDVLREDVRSQNLVSLAEFLKRDTVRKALKLTKINPLKTFLSTLIVAVDFL